MLSTMRRREMILSAVVGGTESVKLSRVLMVMSVFPDLRRSDTHTAAINQSHYNILWNKLSYYVVGADVLN